MPQAHPPLNGIWLTLLSELYCRGPTPRVELRLACKLTNHSMKRYTRLLKLSRLIEVKDNVVWMTPLGEQRLCETLGIVTEPPF